MSQTDAPQIEDDEGPWDEWVARLIILIPFLIVLILSTGFIILTVTGIIPVNVSVGGTISISTVFNTIFTPLVLLFGGLMALTWLMALMKEYGSNPVTWVVNRIGRAAANYNPPEYEPNSRQSTSSSEKESESDQ